MADPEFDERLERVRRAAEVISDLPTKTLQADAFHYLIGQPITRRTHSPTAPEKEPEVEVPPQEEPDANTSNGAAESTRSSKRTSTRKSRPSGVNPDKNLELSPAGKQSLADFVSEKKPSTQIEKYTVCIFWMLNIAEYPKAGISQIVTCYHAMNWALPTNIRNTASQAGKKEFDNTAGLDDIKLSSLGRNLVLALPKKDAKK